MKKLKQIINKEKDIDQLKQIDLNKYEKEELEYLNQLITIIIERSSNYYVKRERRKFQNKIRRRLCKIKINENLNELKFGTNDSYTVFKILFDYFEDKTKLASNKLTWENIWETEELNLQRIIFIPTFPTEIENPIAYLISRMKITEGLVEYNLDATNEEDLKKQFLEYHKKMMKYYENESEEIDDFQDDDYYDNFGEPFYETD